MSAPPRYRAAQCVGPVICVHSPVPRTRADHPHGGRRGRDAGPTGWRDDAGVHDEGRAGGHSQRGPVAPQHRADVQVHAAAQPGAAPLGRPSLGLCKGSGVLQRKNPYRHGACALRSGERAGCRAPVFKQGFSAALARTAPPRRECTRAGHPLPAPCAARGGAMSRGPAARGGGGLTRGARRAGRRGELPAVHRDVAGARVLRPRQPAGRGGPRRVHRQARGPRRRGAAAAQPAGRRVRPGRPGLRRRHRGLLWGGNRAEAPPLSGRQACLARVCVLSSLALRSDWARVGRTQCWGARAPGAAWPCFRHAGAWCKLGRGRGSGRAPRTRRQTAREIASALTYLHQLDILHGDLSGGNILLASSNRDARGFVAKARPLPVGRRAHAGGPGPTLRAAGTACAHAAGHCDGGGPLPGGVGPCARCRGGRARTQALSSRGCGGAGGRLWAEPGAYRGGH